MNAQTLIAESRQNRVTKARAVVDLASVKEALTALLGMILANADYEENRVSAPAVVARCIAAIIAGIEDSIPDNYQSRLQ